MAKTKATAAKSKSRGSGASGSGESGASSASSSSPTSTPKVGHYDLSVLPVSWDNHPTIRERIRESLNLSLRYEPSGKHSAGYVEGTKESVKLNACVLEPVCVLMSENNCTLPNIDRLIQAIDHYFQISKVSRTLEHCYQESWAIRRMIGKLKTYTYREFPPKDCMPSRLHGSWGPEFIIITKTNDMWTMDVSIHSDFFSNRAILSHKPMSVMRMSLSLYVETCS